MNKQFFCGALAIGVLLAGTAMAQKPLALGEAPQVEQIQKRKFDKEHHEKMAKRLADKLNLTNEQQQKAEQIRKSGQAKIKPLLDEMMELRQKIDKERRANMEEFENILTPEQKTAFEKLKAEDKAKFRKQMQKRVDKRRGDDMLPPPPPEGAILPPPPEDGILPPPEGAILPPPPMDD